MKVLFLIIVFVHGLIHLMGFLKAFELSELKELTLPISQQAGAVWLIGTISFVLFGLLYWLGVKQSFIVGFIAVLISQVIIFWFWKDAKFGTIPNILVLIVSFVSMGGTLINKQFVDNIKNDFIQNNIGDTSVLTENDMAHLPEAVQNYLRYTRCVGQPKVKNFRAEFVGKMYSNPDDRGMKVHSVQYNFYQNPSRYFYMTAKKMGFPACGLHVYKNQSATFKVKMLNWIKVVDAEGDKMTHGETVTVLNDMCVIAPATLIDPRIEWKEKSEFVVEAKFANGPIKVSAELYFNEKYELINFISNDRYEIVGKEYNNYPWSTPLRDYKLLNGYMLPSVGRMVYHKPDGDFTYGELHYKSVEYNLWEMKE